MRALDISRVYRSHKAQYSERTCPSRSIHTLPFANEIPSTMMVIPRRHEHLTSHDVDSCDKEIHDWFQFLGANSWQSFTRESHDDLQSCAEVHWSYENILHLKVRESLVKWTKKEDE